MTAEIKPQSIEERVVYWTILLTWALWLIGGLYIVAPAMGWTLTTMALARRVGLVGLQAPYPSRLPPGTTIWIGGMATLLLALLVGHIEMSLAQTVKSFMGWMKGWALMAAFIYIGSTMTIRPALVYRASNLLAIQTLVIGAIMFVAGTLHLPTMNYVSPLVVLGGSGPEYFNVELYRIDGETGSARWAFFAPWAPAAGLLANIALVFALYEKHRGYQIVGLLATGMVCVMSQSRLAILVAPVIGLVIFALSNLTKPLVFSAGTVASIGALPFLDTIIQIIDEAQDKFKNARASSSRVRATLQSIAKHRWWSEAPIWGHGTVERGPHLVEYMPIGSHHTWNGLLYVKGGVGYTALAIPLAWSIGEMVLKAQTDRVARVALGVLLLLLVYSFAENLETLIYLYWPAMIVVGTAMKRRFVQPLHTFMVK